MPDSTPPILRSMRASGAALRNGSILRATLAFLAFNAVEMGAWTAILVYAYAATGPASVGMVAVLQLFPAAALAPILANIGDRYPRQRVLTGWFLIQATLIGSTGVAILAGAQPIVVYLLSGLATIALTQTRPILASLLPDLAYTPDELTAANALQAIAVGLGMFLGPLAVGVLLGVADPGVAFIVAGIVSLVGAALVASIGGRRGALGAAGDEDDGEDTSWLAPGTLLAGLRAVAGDADLTVVVGLVAGAFLIFGGTEVLLILVAIDLLGIGDSGAGYLIGALGLGSMLGGAASLGLAGRRRLAPVLGIAAVVIGLPIALIGLAPGVRAAALLLVLSGVGFALLETTAQTLLQRITPDAIRARVFGVLEGLMVVAEGVGALIVAPLAVVFGIQGAAIALGLLLPLVAALAVVRFARIDARVAIPEAELHALRHVGMFAPLGPAALESVARHLVRIPVAAGTVVIHEGDAGDRWYLIAAGRFRVMRGGEVRDEMGHGEAFGEIALLRDVPRTATVIAIEDADLWYLERDEFLAAVTGSPKALLEAERVAAARL